MHRLAVIVQRNAVYIHTVFEQNVRVHHNIAGYIESLGLKILASYTMLQYNMKNLVHQHKINLAVGERIHKIGAEGYAYSVGAGGFGLFVNSIFHMHKQYSEKAVVAKNPSTCEQQPLCVFAYSFLRQSHSAAFLSFAASGKIQVCP